MIEVFADSFYFFALISERDSAHDRALSWGLNWAGGILTTKWVLLEIGDGLATSQQRIIFPSFFRSFCSHLNVRVLGWEDDLFEAGLDLYENRSDKQWSLTDCISFTAMQREGVREALTADHHFEQAGYRAIFAK